MVAHWLVAVSRFIDSGGYSVQIFSLPPVHNKDVRLRSQDRRTEDSHSMWTADWSNCKSWTGQSLQSAKKGNVPNSIPIKQQPCNYTLVLQKFMV